jgi:hypothetical protein
MDVVTLGAAKAFARQNFAPVSPFEGVKAFAYGDSFTNGGAGSYAGTKFIDRIVARLRTLPLTNQGVGGTRSDAVATKAFQTWVPGDRGIVFVSCLQNDINQYGSDPLGRKQSVANLDALMSLLSSGKRVDSLSSAFAYTGTWDTSATSQAGAPAANTNTTGSYVDVTFTGPAAAFVMLMEGGTRGGVVTATQGGTTLGTLDTSGCVNGVTSYGVLKVSGLSAGANTVRLTFTSGNNISIDSVLIPNPKPPTIMFFNVGGNLNWPAVPGDPTARNAALVTTQTALAPVLASYSNVVTVNAAPEWDPATMTAPDGQHVNDRGNFLLANKGLAALGMSPTAFRDGLHQLSADYAYSGTSGGFASGTLVKTIAGQGALLKSDDFNRTGNLGGSTASGGGVWTAGAGQLTTIAGHTVIPVGGSQIEYSAWLGAGQADMVVDVPIKLSPTANRTNISAMARVVDINNYLLVSLVPNGGLTLYARVAGTYTGRGTVTVSNTPGTSHTITIKTFGNVVKVYYDLALIITYTLSAGEITAFGSGQGAGVLGTSSPSSQDDGGSQHVGPFKIYAATA